MSQQACVTTYFPRKRKKDFLLPSLKRKRLDDELSSDVKSFANVIESSSTNNERSKTSARNVKHKNKTKNQPIKDYFSVMSGTNVKQVVEETPTYAYNKYRSLAQTVPKGLVLPHKFKILKDMFLSLDTVVSMLYNRQETVTWRKVKVSVQEMLKKNFELAHLAQIKHVYSDAYEFQQEAKVSFSDHSNHDKYELTLQPILKETGKNLPFKMNAGMLIKRRHHFHLKLMDVVKEHHQNFLKRLTPPIVANNDELRRWHPEFQLDMVPDIPAAQLPSSPSRSRLECTSAQEALEKTRNKLTKKAATALRRVSLLSQKCSTPTDSSLSSQDSISDSQYSLQLKGVSAGLLAKIRQKEAERKSMMMLRSEEECDELDHLKRLPDVARALRSLFVDEKKSSLPFNHIASKLSKCCPLVSTSDSMDKHLRLLSKKVSSWFTVTHVRGQEYGRMMNKDLRISDVICILQACLKKAEGK